MPLHSSGLDALTDKVSKKSFQQKLLCFLVACLVTSCSVSEVSNKGPGEKASTTPVAQKAKEEPSGVGSKPLMRLMTAEQYLNTISYVFGPDVRPDTQFAPAQRTNGLLQLGSFQAGVTATQLEVYQKIAASVAALAVDPKRRSFLISCKPADDKAADKACATAFLKRVGRLLYRRPLTNEKTAQLVEQANVTADKLKDFYAGLEVALEAMLVSPNVQFIAETSEPDPKRPGRQRLDAFSLASRLSFFLWNAAPDDALLKAAESGEIQTEKGRARIIDMMLASPRLEAGMRAFFDDMFVFEDFNNLAKDPKVYPFFTGVTVQDAREQTLRTVIDHLITKKKDYRDIFTTRETFISPSLAALYKLPSTDVWAPYEFPPDSRRVGVLSQIGFLSVHSHPGRSSVTLRGKALREILLCQKVPDPPGNVDFSILEDPKASFHTARERLAAHATNPVCAGCHKIIDPIGLALENFDGAGRYRESELGVQIDPSGILDGKSFQDAVGLAQALHDHPAVPSCLVRRVYAYGTGTPESAGTRGTLTYFNERFAQQGYRFPDLLRTIALSNAFSDVGSGDAPPVKSAAGTVKTQTLATNSN